MAVITGVADGVSAPSREEPKQGKAWLGTQGRAPVPNSLGSACSPQVHRPRRAFLGELTQRGFIEYLLRAGHGRECPHGGHDLVGQAGRRQRGRRTRHREVSHRGGQGLTGPFRQKQTGGEQRVRQHAPGQAGATASASARSRGRASRLPCWSRRELAAAQWLREQDLGHGEGAPGTADPLGARVCHWPQGEGF